MQILICDIIFVYGKSKLSQSAARRTEMRKGERLSQNPAERIQNYLERLKGIFENEDSEKRERGVAFVKNLLHQKFVINPAEIPEGYFENQRQIAREQGHGDIEISSEMRKQLSEVIIADQESSLDNWVDYLSSQDATYPDWLKYWAFRSMLSMGKYDKEKKQFAKRDLVRKNTVAPFPDINREALAYVLDAIEKKYSKGKINFETLGENEKAEFGKLLESENFAKLYAWAIEKVTPASVEQIAITEGRWVKYDQGSDHISLVESLQGHGTGWCTAGESTAKAQLQTGDFYVYYSIDENGVSRIPRAAIRMQEGNIAEVRGIAEQQNLDSYIGDIVKEKLSEFPDGQVYEKKNSDMKLLTEIEKKAKAKQDLTKEELIFLYEINEKIEGFGYQRDPRIKEIVETRKPEEDAPIFFECTPEEIAWNQNQINENTKAYIGELFPDIFKLDIEHVYTKFPEGKINRYNIEIGGRSKIELEQEFERKNIYVSGYAKDLLNSPDFVTSKNVEDAEFVRLTVEDLGFLSGATTDEIYAKAQELGLELCPAEVGPLLRLQTKSKEWMLIAMKQITDRGGVPNVFRLSFNGDRLRLSGDIAKPDEQWRSAYRFVFRFRKLET